jgi:hypothetical protein
MNFFKVFILGVIAVFFVGLLAGLAVCADPPPAVIIDVDASAQLAIEEEAPVLPDDFAKNDPPRISANWLEDIPPAVINDDPTEGRPAVVTLFTSDGTWKCKPCEDQTITIAAIKPKFEYATIPVPAAGQSPSGKVPYWLAPDGAFFEGNMDAKTLEKWVADHSPKKGETVQAFEAEKLKQQKALSVVQIDGSSSSAVFAALVDHLSRSVSAAGPKIAQSWLPEIDVDVADPLLAVLDSMLSKDGYKLGGLKVAWPAGKRSVIFDPPVDVAYRKILEVSSKVKSVEINGREVVIRLDGRLINDLKVRLK